MVCITLAEYQVSNLKLIPLILACLQVVVGSCLVYRHYRYRYSSTEKLVLLPIYSTTMWGFILADVTRVIGLILIASNSKYKILASGIQWLTWHMFSEGLALALCQQCAGVVTVKRVIVCSAFWSATTTMMLCFGMYSGIEIMIIMYSTMLLLYLTMWLLPKSLLFRRPALKHYALFSVINAGSRLIISCLGCEVLIFLPELFQAILKPFITFRTMNLDSQYWLGLYEDNVDINSISDTSISLNSPLIGTNFQPSDVINITVALDDLSQKKIPILNNFKLVLQKDKSKDGKGQLLGAGGTSRVYKGTYDNKSVAVKMIYCLELTPEHITNFIQEATRLHNLSGHPNIINIIGVAIQPPALALVIDVCEGGDLYDHIRSQPRTFKEKVDLMLQCAEAVAYLHSKHVLHLDLKSHNFLLSNGQVKLIDLELSQSCDRNGKLLVTGCQLPETINWTAPEILAGLKPSTASDCYALGMVCYEILTSEIPYFLSRDGKTKTYDTTSRRHSVDDIIGFNYRPPINTDWPLRIKDLLVSLWQTEPQHRISAQEVVNQLKMCYEECKT